MNFGWQFCSNNSWQQGNSGSQQKGKKFFITTLTKINAWWIAATDHFAEVQPFKGSLEPFIMDDSFHLYVSQIFFTLP